MKNDLITYLRECIKNDPSTDSFYVKYSDNLIVVVTKHLLSSISIHDLSKGLYISGTGYLCIKNERVSYVIHDAPLDKILHEFKYSHYIVFKTENDSSILALIYDNRL